MTCNSLSTADATSSGFLLPLLVAIDPIEAHTVSGSVRGKKSRGLDMSLSRMCRLPPLPSSLLDPILRSKGMTGLLRDIKMEA